MMQSPSQLSTLTRLVVHYTLHTAYFEPQTSISSALVGGASATAQLQPICVYIVRGNFSLFYAYIIIIIIIIMTV